MFTDQEARIVLALTACTAVLGVIYFLAWMKERFRKQPTPYLMRRSDLPSTVTDQEFHWIKMVIDVSLPYCNNMNEAVLDAYNYVVGFRQERHK